LLSSFLTITPECNKENPSIHYVFFLLCLSCVFLSLVSLCCVFYSLSAIFFFLPPLARSLEGFIYSLTCLYLGKI
jgi:hypothetical protein